ncbi:SDR family oxidoreductase [Tuberibacillus sp. Marseille-P3662]|uniref:SDR family oxidoreductase n=1 Tax=Tuberibacillus sp. Marseille-P3662 TaxID=1965358 RepID=UPI0020CB06C6|nr:SDR family oxidoreductase [Tuberibacillus sp. Marseille-P3662]
MNEDQWDSVIDVNLKGVFMMTQAAALRMKDQERGVILNASSVVGLYGNFGQSNYVASKSGINGLTQTWARELGRYNIRVNSIAPGFVLTDMIKQMPEKVVNMMKEMSLLNDIGKPEDIANAYAFLASNEAGFITGTVLSVDGGLIP